MQPSLIQWLFMMAPDLWHGPEAWRCCHCGTLVQSALSLAWPHCLEERQVENLKPPFGEEIIDLPGWEELITIPANLVQHYLELWQYSGRWDPLLLTAGGQLKCMLEAYDDFLGSDQAWKVREQAGELLREALLNIQAGNGGEPVSAMTIFTSAPDQTKKAAELLGPNTRRPDLLRFLGELTPRVVKAGVSRGYPVWSLPQQDLVEAGILVDPEQAARNLEKAKQDLAGLIKRYFELHKTTKFQVRGLRGDFPDEVRAILKLVGEDAVDEARALSNLLGNWPDVALASGHRSGAAVWCLAKGAGEEKRQELESRFDRFTGAKK